MCSITIDPPIRRFSPKGFTLIELAIVLFVVTLLLGGVLTPLGQQIAERQISETRQIMATARTALVGYALGHQDGSGGIGPLPCPDLRVAKATGQANDGREDRSQDGRCLAQWGNLPWLTLGLPEGDAWGNRLGYAVAENWSQPGFQSGADTALRICSDRTCLDPMPAGALLVSYGRNGLGATNVHGNGNLPPTSPEELENTNGDARFIMRPPRAADRPGGEFDDLLVPLSADWLRGRLCDPASVCNSAVQ